MILKQHIKEVLIRMNCYDLVISQLNEFYYWKKNLKQLPTSFRCYLYNYFISFIPIHWIRIWALRHIVHVRMGKGCFVHLGAFFSGNISIGDDTVIGRKVTILGEVSIGSHCSISAETYIVASGHDKDSDVFAGVDYPIIIDDYVWTGTRSMILMNVHLYTGGVLGAQSVATKDIPAYTVYAGCPAKEIGLRKKGLQYELNYYPFFN